MIGIGIRQWDNKPLGAGGHQGRRSWTVTQKRKMEERKVQRLKFHQNAERKRKDKERKQVKGKKNKENKEEEGEGEENETKGGGGGYRNAAQPHKLLVAPT